MDGLNLPSILTDAEVVFYGGTIALLTGIVQQLSWIPIPDGSRARAWVLSLLSVGFVGLSVPGAEYGGTTLVLALVLSWSALAAASLGLNRAGSFTVQAAVERVAESPVRDYDPHG